MPSSFYCHIQAVMEALSSGACFDWKVIPVLSRVLHMYITKRGADELLAPTILSKYSAFVEDQCTSEIGGEVGRENIARKDPLESVVAALIVHTALNGIHAQRGHRTI